MATKVKIGKEATSKANEIIAFHGYPSLTELVEDLIAKEYEHIKNGDKSEELANRLSGLGYIS